MKVVIKRSVEGGEWRVVVLDKKVVDALYDYNKASETFTYLFITKRVCSTGDDVYNKLVQIMNDSENVMKEFGLDKYDKRAHYLFEESYPVDEQEKEVEDNLCY